jgi:hypothetical protein
MAAGYPFFHICQTLSKIAATCRFSKEFCENLGMCQPKGRRELHSAAFKRVWQIKKFKSFSCEAA